MLDKYLAVYLFDDVDINAEFGGRIYQTRAPQGASFPYVVIGGAHDIDHGQTADRDLLREIGEYNIVIAAQPGRINSIQYGTLLIEDLLKACRNRFIPAADADDKLWVQCIILHDRQEFYGRIIDGGQEDMVGYLISIRSGYDTAQLPRE